MSWSLPSIVLFILGLLAILFPYRPPQNSPINFGALKYRYQKWETFAIIPLFIFLPLMTYLFGYLFSVLYDLTREKEGDVIYEILPHNLLWYAAAGVLSFGLIVFPMTVTYKLLLKDDYEEYTLYTNLKHGFDGMKVWRPVAWILGIATVVGLFLLTDYSIKISDSKMKMNGFLSITSKEYSYEQIHSIYFVEMVLYKKGSAPQPHFYIKFSDNTVWNTRNGLRDENKQDEIVKFLSKKSNVKIDTLLFDPE